MTNQTVKSIQVYSALGMLIFGCLFTLLGFFVEPVGEVSGSVLWVFAQSLIYAGSALGIHAYINAKFNELKNQIS